MKLIDILVEELPKRGGWPDGAARLAQDPDGDIQMLSNRHAYLVSVGWTGDGRSDCYGQYAARKLEPLASDYATAIITREQYEAALAEKDDGWIEWGGGECPVDEGTLVDVRYRNGEENHHVGAGIYFDDTGSNPDLNAEDWISDGSQFDIIAYRLHQTQKAELVSVGLVDKPIDDACRVEEDLNDCVGQAPETEWKGGWLPSAGCECEYQYKVHGSEWCSFECVAVDGNAAFGWSNNTPIALQLNTHNFRPMRSKAERNRDDAKHAIAELCRSSASNGHAADLIYDAIAAGEIPGVKLDD